MLRKVKSFFRGRHRAHPDVQQPPRDTADIEEHTAIAPNRLPPPLGSKRSRTELQEDELSASDDASKSDRSLPRPTVPINSGRRPKTSDPSENIQTPASGAGIDLHAFAASSSSPAPRTPTFRLCADKPCATLEDIPDLVQKVKKNCLRMISESIEDRQKYYLIKIADFILENNPLYGYAGCEPACNFTTGLDLQYLGVTGGTSFHDTAFHKTLKEIYDQRNGDGTTKQRNNRISQPDGLCVASTAGHGHKGLPSGKTQPRSEPGTDPSLIEKRCKKRSRMEAADRALVDVDLCITSLVVEMKMGLRWKQLCQLLAYVIQAFEICACRLAMTMNRGRFARLYVVSQGQVWMETKNDSLWDEAPMDMLAVMSILDKKDYFAHAVARDDILDESAIAKLLSHLVVAAQKLQDAPFIGVTYDMLASSDASLPLDLYRQMLPVATEPERKINDHDAVSRQYDHRMLAVGARPELLEPVSAIDPILRQRFADMKKEKASRRRPDEPVDPDEDVDDDEDDDDHDGRGGDAQPDADGSNGGAGADDGPNEDHGGNEAEDGEPQGGNAGGHAGHDDSAFSSHLAASPLTGSAERKGGEGKDAVYDDSDGDSDGEIDRPDPHDLVLPTLRKLGVKIKFCSPDTMTRIVVHYASHSTVSSNVAKGFSGGETPGRDEGEQWRGGRYSYDDE